MQARSLGSVLLRKGLKLSKSNNFNVFTIDFNEELVGLNGESLHQQVQFVHLSIKTMLSLYEFAQFKPRSVIVVGHSVGGVVARALFMLEDFDPRSVSLLLTFASPVLAPVICIDYKMARFYDDVNKYWDTNWKNLYNVSVLSISGGEQDLLVRHSLTRLNNRRNNCLSTSLLAVPGVNLTTDHQAIVWCKQLVLTTTRFLYRLVDDSSNQITEDVERRHRLMNLYFGETFRSVKHSLHINSKVKLLPTYTRTATTQRYWSLQHPKSEVGLYYTFEIDYFLNLNASTFVARISSSYDKWILVCSGSADCSYAINLSAHAQAVQEGRLIRIDLALFKGFSHILIRMPPHKAITSLEVNIASRDDDVSISVPSIFSNLWTLNKGYDFSINSSHSGPRFYYRVNLVRFSDIYQCFLVKLMNAKGLLEYDPSWDEGMARMRKNSIMLKLDYSPDDEQLVFLHVYSTTMNPSLNIQSQFLEGFQQILRQYFAALPQFVLVIILLVYSYQVKELVQGKQCPSESTVLFGKVKPYKIQPFISLINFMYRYDWFVLAWTNVGLPIPDSVLLSKSHGVWFAFCPFILFIVAFEVYFVLMFVQKVLSWLLLGFMKFFTIKFFTVLHNANYVRAFLHSIVLSVITPVNSSYALLYIYATSLISACYLTISCKSRSEEKIVGDGAMRIVFSQIWLWLFLYSAATSTIFTHR